MLFQLPLWPIWFQNMLSDQDTDPHIAGNPLAELTHSKDQTLLAGPQNAKLDFLIITFLL